jgi:hypothetical protein
MDTQSPQLEATIELYAPDLLPENAGRLGRHGFTQVDDSPRYVKDMSGTYTDLLTYTNSMRGVRGVLKARIDVKEQKKDPDMGVERK